MFEGFFLTALIKNFINLDIFLGYFTYIFSFICLYTCSMLLFQILSKKNKIDFHVGTKLISDMIQYSVIVCLLFNFTFLFLII